MRGLIPNDLSPIHRNDAIRASAGRQALGFQDILADYLAGVLDLGDRSHAVAGTSIHIKDLENRHGDGSGNNAGKGDNYYQLKEAKAPLTLP